MNQTLNRFVLATLIAAGANSCASSKRLARSAGWAFEEKPQAAGSERQFDLDSGRSNAFPIAYSNGARLAVLWPFFDKDAEGLAIRPVFNKEGQEYSVLFPLAAWNPENGDGWFLTGYWNKKKDRSGIFPIYGRFGEDFYAGPVIRYHDGLAVLPFFYSDKDDFWMAELYSSTKTPSGRQGRSLGGVLAKWKFDNNGDYSFWSLPISYHSKTGNEVSHLFAPFWYSQENSVKTTRWTPLASWGGHKDDSDSFFNLHPLWWSGHDQVQSWNGLLPIYFHTDDKKTQTVSNYSLIYSNSRSPEAHKGSSLGGLLADWKYQDAGKNQGDYHFWSLPVNYHAKNGDKITHLFAPLWYSGEDKTSKNHWTPLLSWGGKKDDSAAQLNVHPLWWSGSDKDNSWQALLPLYVHQEDAASSSNYSLLTSWKRDKKTDDGWTNVLGLGYHEAKRGKDHSRFLLGGLWADSVERGDAKQYWFYGLGAHKTPADGASSWRAFPLASVSSGQADSGPLDWLSLYRRESDPAHQASSWQVTPLIGSDTHGERVESRVAPLWFRSADADSSSTNVAMLYQHDSDKDCSGSTSLWPLFSSTRKHASEGFLWGAFSLISTRSELNHAADDYFTGLLWRRQKGNDFSSWRLLGFSGNESSHHQADAPSLLANDVTTQESKTDTLLWDSRYRTELELPSTWRSQMSYAESQTLEQWLKGQQDQRPQALLARLGLKAEAEALHEAVARKQVSDQILALAKPLTRVEKDLHLPIIEIPLWSSEQHGDEYKNATLGGLLQSSRSDAKSSSKNILFWNSESRGEHSENSTLFGILQSHEVDGNHSKTRILHYLFQRERKGDEVRTDCFPCLSWDSSPDSNSFTFLAGFLQFKNHKEHGHSGKILWIPYGKKA